jgi:hypothetical protein
MVFCELGILKGASRGVGDGLEVVRTVMQLNFNIFTKGGLMSVFLVGLAQLLFWG